MYDRTHNRLLTAPATDWADLGRSVLDAARQLLARDMADRAEQLGGSSSYGAATDAICIRSERLP